MTVSGREVGAIGQGLLVFIAVAQEDGAADAEYIVDKVANLRVFPDDEGRFDRSALDLSAELLLVSQFTLYADTRRGRRPSFTSAASPETARTMFDELLARFRATGLTVATGVFQEHMDVSLVNDGPVTIWIDSQERQRPRNQ